MAGISVVISASDNATGVINKVNTGLENLNRRAAAARAPIDRMSASLGRFGQITGVDRIASGMGGLAQKIGGASASLGKFAPALGAITSAASIAGLAALVNRWTEFGSRLGFDAQRIGIASDRLHGLQGAARLAGSSAEALTSGMTSLQDGLTNAAAGRAPEMVGLLSQLGISFLDAGGHARKAADVMPQLADKIASIRDPSQRAMVATMAFGSAGESLLPFLSRGAAGIQEYNRAADSYGLFSRRGVEAAQALREEQTRLALSLEGVGNAVSAEVAPVLVPMLRQLSDWMRDNRGEIADFFHTVAQAMKDWVDGGGITLLIERLKAVYDTLARIVGIADAVGHGLRRIWDTTAALPQVDEYGRPVQPTAPATGLPPPPATVPTVPDGDTRTWWQRVLPTGLGGRAPPGAQGSSQTIPLSPGEREQNARSMARVLMDEGGFTREGASALLGGGIQESGLNPRAGAGGAHQGTFQWSDERRSAIEAHFGKAVTAMSPDESARAAIWELQNRRGFEGINNTLRTSHDIGVTNYAATHDYESPGNYGVEIPHRLGLSKGVLDRLNSNTSQPQMYGTPATPLPTLAAPVPPVPAMAPLGAQGQPGPDGRATVRLTFDNPPPGLRTSAVAQGPLRVETPHLDNSP